MSDDYLERPEEIIPLPSLRYDEKAWRMHTMETDSKYLQTRFDLPANRPMSQSIPDDFKPKPATGLQNFGANFETIQLPPMSPAVTSDQDESK